MSFPSYSRFVGLGLTQEQADTLDKARDHGRISAQAIETGDYPIDAVMMGVLDAAVGILIRTFGAAGAGDMMAHYADVCRRNADRTTST